ncbi:hypothetical protein WAI453_005921 [Rhynchosporium graminicola]
MASPPILLPMTAADIPDMAKATAEAFLVDRQTIMKGYGGDKYDMKQETYNSAPGYITNWKVVYMKAVHSETGETMGTCAWGFRGLQPEEVPHLPGTEASKIGPEVMKKLADEKKAHAPVEEEQKPTEEQKVKDGVARLNSESGEDLNDWMEKMMPDGTRCMYIVGLTVVPKFQRQGVSKAFLKWGTDTADRLGLWIWVHSSEGARTAYEAAGFKPIGVWSVDLDEYAPVSVPPEHDHDKSGKWGRYTITYLSYGKGRWVPE